MIRFLLAILPAFIFTADPSFSQTKTIKDVVIANGQMPNIARDKSGAIHLVFGKGDSIMYASSKNGTSFSSPTLVAILPALFASSMRGPQIAANDFGITITACTHTGNIFSYTKQSPGSWSKAKRVNEVDEMAKEALMALSGDGMNLYAVWLGVKKPKGQNVYGAKSVDGGKTWNRNTLVYASPDSSVCECCKPSVVVNGNNVYVMFRNWLHGSRDLYIINSTNVGESFEHAKKLGEGTWKLNACPMDGGGIALNKNGNPTTVWRREGKIYASAPGAPEKELGEGKGCSIETVNDKEVYAWGENGNVVFMDTKGVKRNIGKGSLPLVKALNKNKVLCIWQDENQIHGSVVEL